MTVGRIMLTLVLTLFVVACAPAADRTVPGSTPVFYAATNSEVFGAVIQAISTSPGLNNSNGWIISQSDSQGGFIRADTVVTTPATFWLAATQRSESLSVVISPAGENRTQVVIQLTSGATSLQTRIRTALSEAFGLSG